MQLRDYQQRAIDLTWEYVRHNQAKNPCIVIPTGGGKSIIVAEMCRNVVTEWGGRVMMLTSVKELVAQNAEKMRAIWPGAPMGIYSASLKKRELGEPITFAGVQSVFRRAAEIGHVDIVLVDEAHQIGHEDQGMYRDLIAGLREVNPNLIVIGLTATPFRMGHGCITDDPAIFDELINPTSIEELIYRGFLAPLRSKRTASRYDLSGVHKRGGEYIEKELAAAVDTEAQNDAIVREVISKAEGRKHWLFFCTSVEHAYNIRDKLAELGVTAQTVVGETPGAERDEIIRRYKAGEFTALTSVGVLTTGFDYPDIDLIAALRPTMSVNLYIQMGGRGLRLKSHTDHCLFLDFAGLVKEHGPITSPITPDKAGKGGKAPTKDCPGCAEQVAPSVRVCPDCGYEWPPPEEKPLELHNDDIMGNEPNEMNVTGWDWRIHDNGKQMLRVDYHGSVNDPMISEYLCVWHGGWTELRARKQLHDIAVGGGFPLPSDENRELVAGYLNARPAPKSIAYKMEGDFFRVISREWPTICDDDDDIPF